MKVNEQRCDYIMVTFNCVVWHDSVEVLVIALKTLVG